MTLPAEDFQIEWHRNCVVVIPAQNAEELRWELIDHAADAVLAPLAKTEAPLVVFDLSTIQYFGSVFLSLLLKCHKAVRTRGGEIVLCGPSAMARELLGVTALDTLWAVYDSRQEALEALAI